MTTHVIEVGPNIIRELCCDTGVSDDEMTNAALDSIDDPVTLVDFRPVAVDALWRSVLSTHACGNGDRAIVVHPSWWASTRIEVLSAAAQGIAAAVEVRPRSWLLTSGAAKAAVVVEITDNFVVITGAAVAAETRRGETRRVGEAVVRCILEMMSDRTSAVVIDAPSTVSGVGALASMIADGLRVSGISAVQVDDLGLKKLAEAIIQGEDRTRESPHAHPSGRKPALPAVTLIVAVVGGLVMFVLSHHATPADNGLATTYLVEGHVAVEVPAQWPMRRVVAGPGSARVQVTSPSDPEVALHVTQSPVVIASLSATAESLKQAIDGQPTGVFVDFNPTGSSAGRPAVTYREVRPGHDVRWIVLVDKAVRISIGCQSRHGQDDAVRQVCEVAVRSARAVS